MAYSKCPPTVSRRRVLECTALGVLAMLGRPRPARAESVLSPLSPPQGAKIVVYKDPSCGCCQSWVEHMRRSGYVTSVTNSPNMDAIRREHQVPVALQSCHTTLVGGYVIEGHVPASDVTKLLSQKPKGIKGLTIPGMPKSAPGMDLTPFEPYTVFTFDAAGKTAVYAKHDRA